MFDTIIIHDKILNPRSIDIRWNKYINFEDPTIKKEYIEYLLLQ